MSPPQYHNGKDEASGLSSAIGTLVGVRFIGAQKPLIHALGLNAAIYLNECLYWQAKVGLDTWFGRTVVQMQEETGLSKAEQATAREALRDRGLIEERKGVQYRNQTRINQDAFAGLLDAMGHARDSAVPNSAAGFQQVENQPLKSEQLAVQKPAASRPEISGSYNSQEHTKNIQTDIHYLQPPEPYDVWATYCDARGLPVDHLRGGQQEKELYVAKKILEKGISVSDVAKLTTWLMSDPWWIDKGFSLNAVLTQYARWVSSGKPTQQKAPGSKAIRGTTPTI